MRLHTPTLKELPCQKHINVVSRKNTGAEKTIENSGVFENGCTYMTLYCVQVKPGFFLVPFLLGERDVKRVEVVRAKQISCDHAFLFLLCQPVLFLVSMKNFYVATIPILYLRHVYFREFHQSSSVLVDRL